MSISKIQSGDLVQITTGNYKGTQGTVTKIVTKVSKRKGFPPIVRAAVNTVPSIVKYRKANRAYNLPGEKLTTDRLINVSNLRLVDNTGKISRVSIEVDATTNKKVRTYKTTGKAVAKAKPEVEAEVVETTKAKSTTKKSKPTK